MDKYVDYDPLTGIKETTWDDGEKMRILKEQDIQPLLDRNARIRAERATDIGIKKGLWHYANVPVVEQYELLKKGINIFRAEDFNRAVEEINRNYPYLKTTDKTHSVAPKRIAKRETSKPPGILLSGS